LKTNAKGRAWFYYGKLEKHTCFGSINYITTNAKGRAWFYYTNSKNVHTLEESILCYLNITSTT
jgi:hypothetical protein